MHPWHCWLKKSTPGRKLLFLDKQLQMSEEIMDAQNFNFAPKFPQNGFFSPQILHLLTTIFSQEKFLLTIF